MGEPDTPIPELLCFSPALLFHQVSDSAQTCHAQASKLNPEESDFAPTVTFTREFLAAAHKLQRTI
jgi:hypothetical protein